MVTPTLSEIGTKIQHFMESVMMRGYFVDDEETFIYDYNIYI